MIINKFIIVLCLIFIVLLLTKITRENFQDSPSPTFSVTDFCSNHNGNDKLCKYFEDKEVCRFNEDNNECSPHCTFDPNTEPHLSQINGLVTGEDKFKKCDELCESQGGSCHKLFCHEKCLEQGYENAFNEFISYRPMPTDISANQYKEQIADRLQSFTPTSTDPLYLAINNQIINPLKNEFVLNELDKTNLKSQLTNLNILTTNLNKLKDLDKNSLSNQEDNILEHIERLIEQKKGVNKNVSDIVKAKMIENKINKIKDFIKVNGDNSTDATVNNAEPIKSIRCIANGLTLNVEPIVYTDNDEQYYRRDNDAEYLIYINKSNLFFEPRAHKEITLDDGSTTIEKNNLCSTTNNLCKYTVTNGTLGQFKNNIVTAQSFNTAEDVNVRNSGAYFKIIEIKNNTMYNNYLKRAESLNFDVNSEIKYPFYLIQPFKLIGNSEVNIHGDMSVKLKKKRGEKSRLVISKVSNTPEERFEAYTYRVVDPIKCEV
tara:strand:- start:1075 stop:2538 length:1464 start_codon:yes stop_codon:yes gene_type:complete